MTHEEADRIIQEILEEDPTWKKCYPCINHGICCDGAEIRISLEESKIIEQFLKEHPDILAYAISRKKENKICIFHNTSAKKCLIHDIRPLICRITPMKGIVIKDFPIVSVYEQYSNFTCNHMRQVFKYIFRRGEGKIYTLDKRIYFDFTFDLLGGQENCIFLHAIPIFS